jgi:hypothetical protein
MKNLNASVKGIQFSVLKFMTQYAGIHVREGELCFCLPQSLLTFWMQLEDILLSKVSQAQKDKGHHVFSHTWKMDPKDKHTQRQA